MALDFCSIHLLSWIFPGLKTIRDLGVGMRWQCCYDKNVHRRENAFPMALSENSLSQWPELRVYMGIRYTMAYPFSGFFRYPSHVIFTCSWPGNGIPGTGLADGSARSSDAGHGPGSLGSGRVPLGVSCPFWLRKPANICCQWDDFPHILDGQSVKIREAPENMGWFPKLNNHEWSLVYVYSKLCKKRHCGALKS